MNKVNQATQFMIDVANDNSHGYSQANRWGNPDYDCSSLVITAWQNAGVPVKTKGATYTGNMKPAFLACGFKDVTSEVNLATGSGLKTGDVCLNINNHVVMYIGNGKIAHARSSEGNTQAGDQSGNEIRIQNYWNYPWDVILRYEEQTAEPVGSVDAPSVEIEVSTEEQIEGKIDTVKDVQIWLNRNFAAGLTVDGFYGDAVKIALTKALQKAVGINADGVYGAVTNVKCRELNLHIGSRGTAVKVLQAFLVCYGYKSAYVDGQFGSGTSKSLIDLQKKLGLVPDGIAAQATFKALCS